MRDVYNATSNHQLNSRKYKKNSGKTILLMKSYMMYYYCYMYDCAIFSLLFRWDRGKSSATRSYFSLWARCTTENRPKNSDFPLSVFSSHTAGKTLYHFEKNTNPKLHEHSEAWEDFSRFTNNFPRDFFSLLYCALFIDENFCFFCCGDDKNRKFLFVLSCAQSFLSSLP